MLARDRLTKKVLHYCSILPITVSLLRLNLIDRGGGSYAQIKGLEKVQLDHCGLDYRDPQGCVVTNESRKICVGLSSYIQMPSQHPYKDV